MYYKKMSRQTTIKINKPLYRGLSYWKNPEFGEKGVGIRAEACQGNGTLLIETEGQEYFINKKDVRDFVESYGSKYYTKYANELYVIPLSICKKLV